ncbi:MAG: SMP-30/gluconolactonase/LRE family protein [Propionibacteriaceae bacterium]|nr:SMP-30/gluconolactonase/LRE family protein [Propionibacteriaceae bacterium]
MGTYQTRYELLPVQERDQLGEGPWWSRAEGLLTWVDIWGRRIRQCALDGSRYREWHTPSDVGFVVPTVDGKLITGLADGLRMLDPSTGEFAPSSPGPIIADGHRINDGKTDRRGRLWFGTIREDNSSPSAALYRYDGTFMTLMLSGVVVSNGVGWSPQADRMYFADSPTRRIDSFAFEPDGGDISAREAFSVDEDNCTPDGLTVDAEGCIWSAKWDGGKVVRYTPDGGVVETLRLPVRRPTSCMFVGPDLDMLAITSAQSPNDDSTGRRLAGSVFLVHAGVQGIAEKPFEPHAQGAPEAEA